MSIKAINWALMQAALAPSPKLVLIVLANRANAQFKAWPSIETICRESGLSDRTARRALSELEKASLIEHVGFSFRAKCYLLKVPTGFEMPVEAADLTGQIDHVTGQNRHVTGHDGRLQGNVTGHSDHLTGQIDHVTGQNRHVTGHDGRLQGNVTGHSDHLTGQIDHVTGHGDNVTGHHDRQTIMNHQRNHQEPSGSGSEISEPELTIDTAWRPLVRQVQDVAGYDLARLMPSAADGGEVRQWLADITAKGHSVQGASEIILMAVSGVMERRRDQGPPNTLRYFRNAVAEMAAATPTREAARMEAAYLEYTKVEMRHKRRPKSWTVFQKEWSSAA
ncbi:helix-turn-helix domain-containing protein [Komagataeibacter sp. FNDCF1]|uniref:helix-turn-helix domain-containing protein n=1 Tax=Komagataeibacter sp. FNDCF1 TaxID=2878681 RepID=UPI001E32962C|nr:helix-turn-helix domain-containing protein [Komagataeibacter sp. FNDCF1]MCE2563361.1 helix-turn-helix domain-containing protein [Komagataeibacter sp. FNDCF1]